MNSLLALRILAVLIILGSFNAARVLLGDPDARSEHFPQATPALINLALFAISLGVCGLIGLVFRRRWGLYLFIVSIPAGLAFDVLAKAWMHVPVAVISASLVLILAFRVRGGLRSRAD